MKLGRWKGLNLNAYQLAMFLNMAGVVACGGVRCRFDPADLTLCARQYLWPLYAVEGFSDLTFTGECRRKVHLNIAARTVDILGKRSGSHLAFSIFRIRLIDLLRQTENLAQHHA